MMATEASDRSARAAELRRAVRERAHQALRSDLEAWLRTTSPHADGYTWATARFIDPPWREASGPAHEDWSPFLEEAVVLPLRAWADVPALLGPVLRERTPAAFLLPDGSAEAGGVRVPLRDLLEVLPALLRERGAAVFAVGGVGWFAVDPPEPEGSAVCELTLSSSARAFLGIGAGEAAPRHAPS